MSPFVVSLISNIFLGVVLVIGFLVGFKRGIKKSGLRLAFFVVSTVLAFFIAPPISNALMGIQLTVDGQTMALGELIVHYLSQIEGAGEVVTEGSAIAIVAERLPVVLINLVVFMLLFLLLDFIFWIVYKIVAHFVFKKRKTTKAGEKIYTIKEGQAVELVEVDEKPKKYGILGALVSTVQAFFFAFFLLLPVSGVVSLVREVSYARPDTATQSVQAVSADDQTQNLTALGSFVEENVPSLLSYLDAYDTSVLPVITQVLGFQDLCFDGISSTSVDGERLVLRKEVVSISSVFEVYDYISKFDFELGSYADLDFDMLNGVVDTLFESGLIRYAGPEATALALDLVSQNINLESELISNEEVVDLVLAVRDGILENGTADALEADLKALLSSVEMLCKNGVVDTFMAEDTESALNILTANDASLLKNLLTTLTSSNSVKRVLVGGVNIALSAVETQLESSFEVESVNLDRVDLSKMDWTSVTDDVSYMVTEGVDLYSAIQDFDTSSLDTMLAGDYSYILSKLANVLDRAQNSKLVTTTVNGTNVIDNLIVALKDFKVDEDRTLDYYLNLGNYKKSASFSWKNELNSLTLVIDQYKTLSDGIESFETFNYDDLDAAVSNFFETKTVSALRFDNVMTYLEEQVVNQEDAFVKDLLETIFREARALESSSGTGFASLEGEALNLTAIIKQVGQAGIIDDINSETLTLSSALSSLCELDGQRKRYDLILEGLTETQLMLGVFESVANYGLSQYDASLGQINTDLDDWTATRQDLGVIIENLNSVSQIYGEDLVNGDIFDSRLTQTLDALGIMLDKVAGLEILDYTEGSIEKNVYDNLLTKFSAEEVGQIVDLTVATKSNIVVAGQEITFWQTETGLLSDIVEVLTSKIYSSPEDAERNALEALVDGEDAFDVIKTLSTADPTPEDGVDDSEVALVITLLISSQLMRDTLVEAINMANFEIEKLTDETITEDTSTLTKFTKDDEVIKNIALQSQDIVGVFKEAILVMAIENPEIGDLSPLLTALETNAKTSYETASGLQSFEGVFKQGYDKLTAYVNAELKNVFGLGDNDDIGEIDVTVIVEIADSAQTIIDKIEEKKNSGETLAWEEIATDADVLTTALTEAKDLVTILAEKTETDGAPIIELPPEVQGDAGALVQDMTYDPDSSSMTEEEFNALKQNILKILGVGV